MNTVTAAAAVTTFIAVEVLTVQDRVSVGGKKGTTIREHHQLLTAAKTGKQTNM
jgi:hypothetical protein